MPMLHVYETFKVEEICPIFTGSTAKCTANPQPASHQRVIFKKHFYYYFYTNNKLIRTSGLK